MEGSGVLLVCIFVPLLGAFLLPILGRISTGIRNIAALLFVLTAFIAAAFALPQALAG